jgi:hypothetical protein
LTLGHSSTVFGVDYFIRKGHQFADRTYHVNKWFCGQKLKFKAAQLIKYISLSRPTHTKLLRHIFVADKGDYYEIGDELPQNQQ